jgi:hypothetical protein
VGQLDSSDGALAVFRRLERWRRQRTGRARIPAALWAAAGRLAREHEVNQVTARKRHEMPAFVELIAPQTGVAPTCVIELEGRAHEFTHGRKG